MFRARIAAEYERNLAALDAALARRHSARGAARAVPEPFLCPITLCLMRDPVCTPAGHSCATRASI